MPNSLFDDVDDEYDDNYDDNRGGGGGVRAFL